MTASDLAPVSPHVGSVIPPRARHLAGTRGLAVNGGALIANVFVSGLTGLFFWVLAARVAPPEVVGNASAMITAVMAVVSLTQQSFVLTLPSLLAVSPNPRRMASRTYALALGLTALAAPIYVLAGPVFADGLEYLRDWHIGLAFIAGACAWCVFSLQDAVLTGVRKGAVVLLENGVWGIARLAIVVAVWAAGIELGVGWLLTAWLLPAAVLVAVVTRYLFANDRSPLVAAGATRSFGRRRLLSFLGAEYASSVLGSAMQLVGGAYALTLLGAREAAPLLTAAALVLVVEGSVASFAQALAVEATKDDCDAERRRNLLRLTALFILGVSTVAVTAGFVAGDQIMGMLGPHYRETGGPALAILMLCVLPRGIIVVSNADNRLRGEGGRNLLQQGVAAATFFGLLLSGTIDSMVALAWALVAARVAASVVAAFQLRRGQLQMTTAR
jgi:hypothetical protein